MINQLRILKRREILILGFSSVVSGLGNWITMMAILSLLIFKGDGGVVESSGIFMAGLLPVMLASPLAGKLADRFNRKNLMMISELGAGATIAIIIFTEKLWLIYLSMALQALFIALMNPARQSALPQLVENSAELEKANAFFQQLNAMLKILAPVIAGFLLTLMNAHQAIILDILSFGLSVLILSRLPNLYPMQEEELQKTDISRKPREEGDSALQVVLRSAALRLLFSGAFFTVLIIVSYDILGSVYIRDVLQGTESMLGTVIGLIGLGSFAVSILIVLRKSSERYWQDLAIGNLLLSLLPLCMALGAFIQDPRWIKPIILGGAFLGGLGNGLLVIQFSTALQITAPRQMLGRISGYLEFTMIGGQMFSVILLPLLVPGILQPYMYFIGAAAAMWILAALIKIQSNQLLKESADLHNAVAQPSRGD